MAKDVRERMVAGATRLLASKGLQATSFSEVIELTDTPRGSIYHHFPGGKDELVLAALERSQQLMLDELGRAEGTSAEQVLETVVAVWRQLLAGEGPAWAADWLPGNAFVQLTGGAVDRIEVSVIGS